MKMLETDEFDHLPWVRRQRALRLLPDGIYYFDADPWSWLSNFWHHPITYKDREWQTTEAAYQAMKTHNVQHQERIRKAGSPGNAKRLGQTPAFNQYNVNLRDDWETVKFDVMLDVLRLKFADPILRQALLDTGDKKLVEGNTWNDRVWGVYDGIGANNLGRSLMLVRAECLAQKFAAELAARTHDGS